MKITTSRFLAASFLWLIGHIAFSQDIPLGAWRLHLSYNNVIALTQSDDRIFAASNGGVLVVDRNEGSVESIDRLNGLSTSGISDIAYHQSSSRLLVAYTDGTLDIIGDEIIHFTRLRETTSISGSKSINKITLNGNIAYLSTAYGVVVFDLVLNDLRETWRNIGASGTTIGVNDAALRGDSIFLATTAGLLAGNLRNNLLDFNLWKRSNTGDLSGSVGSVETFGDHVYAAVNGKGLYRRNGNRWEYVAFAGQNVLSLHAQESAFVLVANGNIYSVDQNGQTNFFGRPGENIQVVMKDQVGSVLWVGDARKGLSSGADAASFNHIGFNGPESNVVSRVRYVNNNVMALPGKGGTEALISTFDNGLWSSFSSPSAVTDVVSVGTAFYIASWKEGLQKTVDNTVVTWNESNSPLEKNPETGTVSISAMARSSNSVWVANYGAARPLHRITNDSFESFSFQSFAARYPTDLLVDFNGRVWMTLDPSRGGGIIIFDPSSGQTLLRGQGVGQGGLPSNNVNAIALDRDGYVWVGTDAGVSYFYSVQADAVSPLYENRFLLRGEKITSIEIDGGNRKWVGTEKGVWLFNPAGEKMIYNFTEINSSLISDKVADIDVNDMTGEVFFATAEGLMSFRADATASESSFKSIKIFPNPVDGSFSGTVGIEGLATDAVVKITDVSGKLIWQTKANGGTASWNVRDYNGRRAETGIYLVFAATEDGVESVVGKIAVVE